MTGTYRSSGGTTARLALRRAWLDPDRVRSPAVRPHGTSTHRCQRHKECHEAVTSAAESSLEDVAVREESLDAAVRWDRLGDQARAVVRVGARRRGDRRRL